jgi:hypothetical protein
MLAELVPQENVPVSGPGDYVDKAFTNAALDKAVSYRLGYRSRFHHVRGLRYRYSKTEVTPEPGEGLPGRLILANRTRRRGWAEAALADKENGGYWTSQVTETKLFALENTDERSFINETNGSLESNAVAVTA